MKVGTLFVGADLLGLFDPYLDERRATLGPSGNVGVARSGAGGLRPGNDNGPSTPVSAPEP